MILQPFLKFPFLRFWASSQNPLVRQEIIGEGRHNVVSGWFCHIGYMREKLHKSSVSSY